LVQQLLDTAAIADRTEQASARTIAALRDSAESTSAFGPLARLFDQELSSALTVILRGDKGRISAVLADYTAMQNARPDKAVLQAFVDTYISGAEKERLSALIASMSEKELEGSFTIIRRDSLKALYPFFYEFYLDIYACQEDTPFNSYEGYQAVTAKLKYPHLAKLNDKSAKGLFDSCAQLKPQPRANWHEPVQSAIPTLSFGSLFDTQTPASWAKVAIEKLSNAQVFLIPEAGHGALLYQPCVAEMGVAFVDNPKRRFDNACAGSIKVNWHIAPWVAASKK
jgi:pimeloyl-ACP methyl ester carboxylesterase